jgi:DNA-binding NtrC family response regulator/Tfp pilus assembly protein PilF
MTRIEELSRFILAGDTHRAAEAYSSAIAAYQEALKDEPLLDPEARAELRVKTADCYLAVSRYEEAKVILEPLLERGSRIEEVWRARALARVGWADLFRGDVNASLEACGDAASILSPTPHHDDLAEAMRWYGYALRYAGRFEQAFDCYRDALAAARRGKDPSQVTACLTSLGNFCRHQSRYGEAITFHEEALELNRERGSLNQVGKNLMNIALSSFYAGQWAKCEECLEEATRTFRQLGDQRGIILASVLSSRLHRRRGEPSRAAADAELALSLARESSFERAVVLALEELGDIAYESGRTEEARRHYEDALESGTRIAPEGDLVYELSWRLARVRLAEGRPGDAEELAERSITLSQECSDRRELGHAFTVRARIHFESGDRARAISELERALELFEEIRTPFELADAHETLADLLDDTSAEAAPAILENLLTARRILGRLGANHALERVESKIRRIESPVSPESPRKKSVVSEGDRDPVAGPFVAADTDMQELIELARELAAIDATVLIEGETGTGKEILCRLIHEGGPRRKRPFVAINCAAFTPHLLESELFGHRKGAFTGADTPHRGLLESARDGTVLLDEIDKASVDFQTKLLRVIEERRIRPVGSTEMRPIHARVVCATNRDLRELAGQGIFLPDLYYRLANFHLRIPPLRERPDDIHALCRHFVKECGGRFGCDTYDVTPEVLASLLSYPWPGNVRELRNVLESAAFFARRTGLIDRDHLPTEMRSPGDGGTFSPFLEHRIADFERREIRAALKKANGVKAEAARILGVSRKGLNDRLRRLGML